MDVKACVTWIQIVYTSAILQRHIERELNKENLSYGLSSYWQSFPASAQGALSTAWLR